MKDAMSHTSIDRGGMRQRLPLSEHMVICFHLLHIPTSNHLRLLRLILKIAVSEQKILDRKPNHNHKHGPILQFNTRESGRMGAFPFPEPRKRTIDREHI